MNGHHDGTDPSDQENSLRDLPGVAAFAAMGTSLAACLALGVLAGLYLDHLWSIAPFGLIAGIVLGSIAAVTSVAKLVRRFL